MTYFSYAYIDYNRCSQDTSEKEQNDSIMLYWASIKILVVFENVHFVFTNIS